MLVTALFGVLLAFLWSTVALWAFANFWTRRELAFLKPSQFEQIISKQLTIEPPPLVSILLPARNEAKRILSECTSSLLDQSYQNFEIVAVNDCSIDNTGEILQRFADKDNRLRVIAGAQLSAGWLGKPFVLQQAYEHASGEWILTVDADIVFAPNAVEAAIVYAAAKSLDALCLIPFVECKTFWERAFIPTFNWFRMLAMPPSRVNDQTKPDAMGIGNFFLIRRRALEAINGFAAVKNDVAEDLRLASLLKQNRFRIETVYAPALLRTRMYAGFWELWHGFTKNFFAGSNFSVVNSIFGVASIALFGVLPTILIIAFFAAWLLSGQTIWLWLFVPSGLIYALQTALFLQLVREYKQPFAFALFATFGCGLFAAILTNSTVKVLSGSGVKWKDREIYKDRDLRASN